MEKTFKQLLKTTEQYIQILKTGGISTPQELLWYLPRTYEDRTQIKTIDQLVRDGTVQTVKVEITKKSMITTPKRKKLIQMTGVDEKGQTVHLGFLNMTYVLRNTKTKQRYYVVGSPIYDKSKRTYRHPELVPAQAPSPSEEHKVGSIYPIYSELQGISAGRFHKKIYEHLDELLVHITDPLPPAFLQKYHLPDLPAALRELHAPQDLAAVEHAQSRIYFGKLLQRQLISLTHKLSYQQPKTTDQPDREGIKGFLSHLPFELTKAQKKSLKEIIDDLHSGRSMLRLLQGDVGSGKTIVAAVAAWYIITKNKGQAVFLAPLEVLAQQQYRSLAKLLLPLGVRVELLTGSSKPSEKKRIKQGLRLGQIPLIVGTHALLQEDIRFQDLQLAVIDEQHKFGVKQRGFFQQFGSPHILQMTATPIPRSLALAFFGEFTVSTIDELPVGRKPITTKIVSEAERHKLKPRILSKIAQQQRVFVITPLIEDSDKMDELKSAVQQFHELTGLYPELQGRIGLLHGRLKSPEKDEVMKQFKEGKLDMLVSTTVVEVGIDVPEATVMIIMNAERFGLSQLHQLRGRVGRSDIQSYCFLETKNKSGDARQRLRHMEKTNDGFKLAELDLQLRGAGEFLGTRQSGETDIPLHILTDMSYLERVQQAAQELMKSYPDVASSLLTTAGEVMPSLL